MIVLVNVHVNCIVGVSLTLQHKHIKTLRLRLFSFLYRDAGMKFMVGNHWRDLFEVIITKARKPKFFNESKR